MQYYGIFQNINTFCHKIIPKKNEQQVHQRFTL